MSTLSAVKSLKFQSVRRPAPFDALAPPLTPPPPPDPTIILWDDSCHIYTSIDLATWTSGQTPTLRGLWTNLAMPIIDGDYNTCFAVVFPFNGIDHFAMANISFARGVTGTWTDANPASPGNDGSVDHFQAFTTAAISANGNTIIALPTSWADVTLSYPRISRDRGATWADITALGSGKFWARVCFSGGAETIYITANSGSFSGTLSLFKSIDNGVTGSRATPPPTGGSFVGGTAAVNIRCSADGSKVLYFSNWDNYIYLSTDGATTWATDHAAGPAGGEPVRLRRIRQRLWFVRHVE